MDIANGLSFHMSTPVSSSTFVAARCLKKRPVRVRGETQVSMWRGIFNLTKEVRLHWNVTHLQDLFQSPDAFVFALSSSPSRPYAKILTDLQTSYKYRSLERKSPGSLEWSLETSQKPLCRLLCFVTISIGLE